MFELTEKHKELKELLIGQSVYDETFEFASYNDNMLSYYLEHKGYTHEIIIITDGTLLRLMKGSELLNSKNIVYFNYNIYFEESKRCLSRDWSIKK